MGNGGYGANPSVGAFFRAEKLDDTHVMLYEYCMGNGYAAYQLYLDQPYTAISETGIGAQTGKEVSKTYYNIMGQASAQPHSGVNIVVTRYDNGTTRATKVIR
jgi:hypothetical protein